MTDTIRVQFERLSAPVFPNLPIRVKVDGTFTRRGGAAFKATIGAQELRGISFHPDGTGFVGYLRDVPRTGDALNLKRGSVEVSTGVQFQPQAMTHGQSYEAYGSLTLDAPAEQPVTISSDERSVTVGTCTATRRPSVWTRPNVVAIPAGYRREPQNLDRDALANFQRLRDAAVAAGTITQDGPYIRVLSGHRGWADEASGWKSQLRKRFKKKGPACLALWPRIAPIVDATSHALSSQALPQGAHDWDNRFLRELAAAGVDLTPCGSGSTESIARSILATARRFKAPPGVGMHMTGRAVDVSLGHHPRLNDDGTPMYGQIDSSPENVAWQRQQPWWRWLVCNAARFNFYPYPVEPWHWEYSPPATS